MWGGVRYPIFLCMNLLVWVKLGYPPNFNLLGKPLLGEKYVSVHAVMLKKEKIIGRGILTAAKT